ncbi:MAG: hypothetical protein ABIV21_09350 [Pyrinomonadaceae bacterium]
MSKSFVSFIATFAAVLTLWSAAASQDMTAVITIDPSGAAKVEGKFLSPRAAAADSNLSFLLDYAGNMELGIRFKDVYAFDAKGDAMRIAQVIPGEYKAEGTITGWSYTVDLTPLESLNSAVQVSWVKADQGLLVLDDLLPQFSGKTASIRVIPPDGWRFYAAEPPVNEYKFFDVERSVLVIGRKWREQRVTVGETTITLLLSGEWSFSDDEVVTFAAEVFSHYKNLFRSAPGRSVLIAIHRLPQSVKAGNWEASTRGSTVTVASSDMPFKSQALQRLHEQLRHEMFHLWVPNGLGLSGNYDWFYEGFALYQSLKLGVAVNRIRFEDMLDTLSRAYEIASRSTHRLSLIDASKGRWQGANTTVYARGLLVAFLCDLAMLDASRGKRSTTDLLRDAYSKFYAVRPERDGNVAILDILNGHTELRPVIDRYVTGIEPIEKHALINAAGLEWTGTGTNSKLSVTAKPSGHQKDILNKLGYNNWRKLSQKH